MYEAVSDHFTEIERIWTCFRSLLCFSFYLLETTDEAKLNKRIKNDSPLFAESKLNIQGENTDT